MGEDWRQRIRGAWAAMVSTRRDSQRRAKGVDRADQSRRESDWAAAISGYKAYLRRHPRDLGVRVRLIRAVYAAGRFDEAEVLLSEALRVRPDKVELAELTAGVRSARALSIPVDAYDQFRRGIVISRPPVSSCPNDVTVIIDARDRSSRLVDLTLASLRRSVTVIGHVDVRSHNPDRIFRPVDQDKSSAKLVLVIEAGVTLDPHALGWLIHAMAVTDAVAAYGDDDRASGENEDVVWSSPAFHAAPHPLDIATTPRLPAAALFRADVISEHFEVMGGRARLMAAFAVGFVAHVPLLLATNRAAVETPALARATPPPSTGRILTVIPTRDEGLAVLAMIESLEKKAAQVAQLEIVVVDNGSRDPETLRILDALRREKRIDVLVVDEPFNWSRLNNVAAAKAEAEILLFANNDMQMLTDGWDDRLRCHLLQPEVGVVGARLVYPTGFVQHAGMALGALGGKPVHEGLGAMPSEGGPLDRWKRNRPAAAVTGAFMAVRREVFEHVGGFNPLEFAVGCNDIDFCLRVREQGWSVLYAADLELIHQESHSRGHDDTEERMQRARGELEALFRIWGHEAGRDPGRNPHWVNHETLLYYGVRQPDLDQVEAWIRRSVDLWRVQDRKIQPAVPSPIPR